MKTEMKTLDEKCLTVLEKIGAYEEPVSNGDTYRAVYPRSSWATASKERAEAHMERLGEMVEAGLIRKRHSGFYHDITEFGKQVLEYLKY